MFNILFKYACALTVARLTHTLLPPHDDTGEKSRLASKKRKDPWPHNRAEPAINFQIVNYCG